MRIAFDVSPLSHERTGVNNYIRGSLTGLVEVARGRGHEIVAFAPTSPAGKRVIPEALAGLDVELKLVSLPGAHGWRTAWSMLGHPAAERLLGPFDVLHFTDWMYPPQRAGVRATTIHDLVPLHHPQWTTRRTQAMHRRKYRNAARTCDVVFANSAFTADDFAEHARLPARARARCEPRRRRGLRSGRRRCRPRCAVPLDGRDTRAAQEPRDAGRRVRACSRTTVSRSSSSAGPAGASSPSSTVPASCGSAG